MQAAGIFVSALPKLSAGMQVCQHQLDCRHLPFGVNVGRDSTTIVTHRNGSIDMNGHFDLSAKSGKVFVDGIIDNFVNQVMQPSLIGIADEHPWPFPDRFEAF